MAFNDKLSTLRTASGLTQQELADKVYVTHQAIDRWESGDTIPSIDMMKLLAAALDVPVAEFVRLSPDDSFCQSCGMHLGHEHDRAELPDGTLSDEWCKWCGIDGQLCPDDNMDDLIERCAPMVVQAGLCHTSDEAVSLMGAVLPQLKRWNQG